MSTAIPRLWDKPVEMLIRITEVFHRINGEWKMILRHADAEHKKT